MMRACVVAVLCFSAALCLAQAPNAQAPSQPATPTAQQPSQPATPPAQPAVPPPTQAQPPPKPAEKAQELPPTAPVVTIEGLCPSQRAKGKTAAATSAPCRTVVTKAELEKVIHTVRPNLAPAQRTQLAQQYVQLLVVSNAARKAGIEKDSKVQEELRLSRMQILASSFARQKAEQFGKVPASEIEAYYKNNAPQFERVKLQRIYVPKILTEEGKPAEDADSKALAEKIRTAAAAGQDFTELQKQAFEEANNKGTPPSVDLGERRRGSLPPDQEDAIFQLKAGEVSPVYAEASGYYIYKVLGKERAPLEQVREEIRNNVAREKMRDFMEKLRASVKPTLNEAYFGAFARQPGVPPGHPAPPAATSGTPPEDAANPAAAPAADTQPEEAVPPPAAPAPQNPPAAPTK